ncbi:PREDICTED: alpha-1D adrenergic receptor-like [Priapulus caudatus]|uniref:Alpha-1D adrenergic receptor-like n=1 Tax=Priapulus caudatus TaxID=37621 RepID=A0ABM1EK60_PRICU|nr:PREDICTED: alpha-1D adrenergic receptor-like [Priapulus caudatus]
MASLYNVPPSNLSLSALENDSVVSGSSSAGTTDVGAVLEGIPKWFAYPLIIVNVVNIVVNAVVPAHTLIANLAVADVGLGVLGLLSPPTFVVDRPPMVVCVGHSAVITCFAFSSVTTLIAINVDRYVSVSRPLHYHQVMTPRVVAVMIELSWTFAVVVCVGSFVGNS